MVGFWSMSPVSTATNPRRGVHGPLMNDQDLSGSATLPLAGCVIAVTADRRVTELRVALERRGALVEHHPALRSVAHPNEDAAVRSTRTLLADQPDVVVVTTAIGFRAWIEAADAVGLADDLLATLGRSRLIARGPKARGAIEAADLSPDWVAGSETVEEIQRHLLDEGIAGQHIAVQLHGAGAGGLDAALVEAGAKVTGVMTYRWESADRVALCSSVAATADGQLDAVVFTSAPGVEAWLTGAEPEQIERMRDLIAADRLVVATVGPITAEPLLRVGLKPLVPERWRLGAMLRELVGHFAQRRPIDTVAGPLLVRARHIVLDGRTITVAPACRIILGALVDAHGDVVLRGDLLDLLPGDARNPHALDVTIARLRSSTGSPDLVRTVVKRGYSLAVTEA